MTALLARLPQIAGIVAIIASHGAAYVLGTSSAFERGFSEGRAAAMAELAAEASATATRQIKDRLDAENRARDLDADERLRCGPSTRDCPKGVPQLRGPSATDFQR